jgi:hypothetical protein
MVDAGALLLAVAGVCELGAAPAFKAGRCRVGAVQ